MINTTLVHPREFYAYDVIPFSFEDYKPLSNYALAIYNGYSPLSRLIQLRTWAGQGGPSHVAPMRVPDQSVIEAWTHGVRQINYAQDHKPHTRVDLFYVEGMTEADWAAAWAWLKTQVGKPYNYPNIFWFLSRKERLDNWAEIERWICSQLTFVALGMRGVYLQHMPSYKVAPVDIRRSPITYYAGSLYT